MLLADTWGNEHEMIDFLQHIGVNTIAGMGTSAFAVIVGTKFKKISIRMFVVYLITAMLISASVIETWFFDSTIVKSATIGWVIGYVTDDVMLTINAMLPEFVHSTLGTIADGVRNKIDKWFNGK